MPHEVYLEGNGREIVITPDLEVHCDGGNPLLGHPNVYLPVPAGGEAECLYCGRRFLHADNPEVGEVRRKAKAA
ncbi:MAG: zinc-finger domain-containing protein [Geminicoccaceae bacterium]